MDSFPNEECCLRCIYAISRNLDQAWGQKRLWRGDLMAESSTEDNADSGVLGDGRELWVGQDRILEPSVGGVPV